MKLNKCECLPDFPVFSDLSILFFKISEWCCEKDFLTCVIFVVCSRVISPGVVPCSLE